MELLFRLDSTWFRPLLLLFIISSLNLYFAGKVQRGTGTHVSWVEPLLVGTGVSWGVSLWVEPLPLETRLCTVLMITA